VAQAAEPVCRLGDRALEELAQTWAGEQSTLLDEGRCMASERMVCRLLAARGEARERRCRTHEKPIRAFVDPEAFEGGRQRRALRCVRADDAPNPGLTLFCCSSVS
jgi:hypothetical protein